jgi:predicted nuclease of predicted toxin-antitoxin system
MRTCHRHSPEKSRLSGIQPSMFWTSDYWKPVTVVIWDYAVSSNAVIVTKDEDFAIRASVSKVPPLIVWIRIGNCTNTRLLAWFEQELPSIVVMFEAGNRLIEING